MQITWYGHACFLVETAEGSALLDPYAPGSVPGLTRGSSEKKEKKIKPESIMKEPLVSTLICTYNAENTIHWALQSVMDQTYENQEILILDNNSKDKTLDILKDYQKKDKRIKIFSL